MKIYGFIPARMGSSRLPGKPLKFIQGRPMLEHVYERANFFKKWTKLSIATCDQKIKNFCKLKNYNYVMTSKKHKECTDRVYEVTKKINSDIYVILQGDEPLINPRNIDKVILILKKNIKNKFEISTGFSLIKNGQNKNKSIVFLNKSNQGELKFLTRFENFSKKKIKKKLKHIGIFAFTKEGLKKFASFKSKKLEKKENIELLRSIENNQKVICVKLSDNNISVDYPSDIKKVEKQIKNL